MRYSEVLTSLAWADAGVEPIDFPEAPTKALPIALRKANLTLDDIALFEFNEAFSVVVRIAEKVCKIDPAKVNVNGSSEVKRLALLGQCYSTSLHSELCYPSRPG